MPRPVLPYWLIIPSYMIRSPHLSKDEKIVAMSLMALVDKKNSLPYDADTISWATGLRNDEIKTAIEGLKKRALLSVKDKIITIAWGFKDEC